MGLPTVSQREKDAMNVESSFGFSLKGSLTTVLGGLLLIAPDSLATAAPACAEGSIAAARALAAGSQATVEGTVSTPSGAFASSFFDVGFGLQDHSAGIYVSVQTDPLLVPGDRVKVTGTLADSYGLLVLIPSASQPPYKFGHQHPPVAKRVRTGAVGESTEGLLLTVKAKVTAAPSSDLPYGYKFSVDDGSGELLVFVNVQAGIDLAPITVGQKLRVTGFSSQFEDHYEIDPRFAADVVLLPKHGAD